MIRELRKRTARGGGGKERKVTERKVEVEGEEEKGEKRRGRKDG